MRSAFDELISLADGIQLTPGNHPTPSFAEHVANAFTRTHHGFAYHCRAVSVWSDEGACLVATDSVHPPEERRVSFEAFAASSERGVPCVETMYPGHLLGSGPQIVWAMERRMPLAVDVSHLFMQRRAGVLDEATLRRVHDYDRIEEIHISKNDGIRDQHAPIDRDTFGLEWVRDRERSGAIVVLECYMHRMNDAERRRQIDQVRGG